MKLMRQVGLVHNGDDLGSSLLKELQGCCCVFAGGCGTVKDEEYYICVLSSLSSPFDPLFLYQIWSVADACCVAEDDRESTDVQSRFDHISCCSWGGTND